MRTGLRLLREAHLNIQLACALLSGYDLSVWMYSHDLRLTIRGLSAGDW
jgi:hypothetical protein